MKVKVSTQALGLALAAIVAWGFQTYTNIAIPAEIAVALGTVFSIAASLLTPDELEA